MYHQSLKYFSKSDMKEIKLKTTATLIFTALNVTAMVVLAKNSRLTVVIFNHLFTEGGLTFGITEPNE